MGFLREKKLAAPEPIITYDPPRDFRQPYYDRSITSKRLCVFGLFCSYLAGLTSLSIGIWLVKTDGAYISLNNYSAQAIPLALNVLVTLCNDTTGFIHMISLRWALQREGQLTFNSNLRLFTAAKSSKTNSWYTNTFMLACIIMTYASTSFLFISDVPRQSRDNQLAAFNVNTFVGGYSLITLAIGILGQALVATSCLFSSAAPLTWSSDPIDTVAACMAYGRLYHVSGRCLRSVQDTKQPNAPASPRRHQDAAYRAHRQVRIVSWVLWLMVSLALLWGVVMIIVIRKLRTVSGVHDGTDWSFFPVLSGDVSLSSNDYEYYQENGNSAPRPSGTMTFAIPWDTTRFSERNRKVHIPFHAFAWAFALICLLQAFMTLGLHCAEILVNTIRDEVRWRRASSPSGLPRASSNALRSLLASGPGLTLFVFKPAIHWIYSLAVSTYFSVGLVMHPPQIFYLAISAALLALFGASCVFWHFKGPQPAAFGHLQTLADLIDEFPEEGETMFWGRKETLPEYQETIEESIATHSHETKPFLKNSDVDFEASRDASPSSLARVGVAHAGTSATKLGEIDFGEVYMGVRRCNPDKTGHKS